MLIPVEVDKIMSNNELIKITTTLMIMPDDTYCDDHYQRIMMIIIHIMIQISNCGDYK